MSNNIKIDKKIVTIEDETDQEKIIESLKMVPYDDVVKEKITLKDVFKFRNVIMEDVKYVYLNAPFDLIFRIRGGLANFETNYLEISFTAPKNIELIYKDTAVDPVENEDNRVTVIIAR